MTVYPWPCKDNKCDLNVRVNLVWRWRLRRREKRGVEGEEVVKEIGGGVWNLYGTSHIWLTLLENDRNKLFPILASHHLSLLLLLLLLPDSLPPPFPPSFSLHHLSEGT